MARRVFVAMSGGVDSSVAASLLVREGHDVTGVTMLLLDGDGPCCGESGARAARRTCDLLGVPHVVLDMRKDFARGVVGPYADAYAAGETPNPCIDCNARLKFAELLRRVSLLGADALATGHYARSVHSPQGPRLARGRDSGRDQSYFLYRTTQEQLSRLLFPVGEMLKAEVREHAHAAGLPSADRHESREACFAPDTRARDGLLRERHPEALEPGPVVDASGRVLGSHRGISRYTVGQRAGLGSDGGPVRYVLRVDASTNTVVAGPHGDLAVTRIEAADPVWHPVDAGTPLTARVRYRGEEVPCAARLEAGVLRVVLERPLHGVSPGQAVVCYAGDIVVGGGRIGGTG